MSDEVLPILQNASFLAWIADNRQLGIHRHGYNGVAALVPRASGNNLFVPTYAGLNYETIGLTGLSTYRHEPTKHDHQSKFEPRNEAMRIESADEEQVVLVQPESPHSGVAARITFRVEEPHYLHQRIELTFHKRFSQPGVPSAFHSLWASYLHMPPDRHLYLRPDGRDGADLDGWFGITSAGHGAPGYQIRRLPDGRTLAAAEHLEAMSAQEPLADSEVHDLGGDGWPAKAPLSFYYGLCHDDLLLLQMFRQPESVRFAYSPCGGGEEPAWCPAWDYVLTLDDALVGSTHMWELCLVVKPFAGRQDVVAEIGRYLE